MKRSKFSLSNTKLLSCDMGELVPCGLTEILPGDSIQQATNALVRFSPMLAPAMHRVDARIHHWFVPTRLVWDDFEKFITGGPDGMDASVFPTMVAPPSTGYAVGSLADYLGIPTGVADLEHSAIPLRMYAMIWNEWYRDQDLQTPLVIDTTSGPDTTTSKVLKNVSWEKDYFTSARPWEQKGPAITIPLGTSAPVTGIGFGGVTPAGADGATYRETGGLNTVYARSRGGSANPPNGISVNANADGTFPNVQADLSSASAITINLLREAFALQRFEEARARYGSRYVEYLRYLGVKSSDARLQRPEYLGGGKNAVQISEVLQTAEGTEPVGDMAGHGIASMRSNRYRRYFEEHGYVLTFISVKPKTIYMQGLFRTWNRRTKEDFFQKELQHIGQQEVLNKEIKASHASPDDVFGYQDRYDEYRRAESSVAGEFRTTDLNFWHFAREFSTDPALNGSFVESVPTDRVFAVPSKDVLYVMANHSIQARRIVAASGNSFIF